MKAVESTDEENDFGMEKRSNKKENNQSRKKVKKRRKHNSKYTLNGNPSYKR